MRDCLVANLIILLPAPFKKHEKRYSFCCHHNMSHGFPSTYLIKIVSDSVSWWQAIARIMKPSSSRFLVTSLIINLARGSFPTQLVSFGRNTPQTVLASIDFRSQWGFCGEFFGNFIIQTSLHSLSNSSNISCCFTLHFHIFLFTLTFTF